MGRVDVIGLGPAGSDLLTSAAAELIDAVPDAWLRTRRHPAAEAMADAADFDHLYLRAETFDEVYGAVVDSLVQAAAVHGRVLYAVPGSPSVAEATVDLLRERAAGDDNLQVVVHPAMSFLDLVWERLGIDPVATGVRLVDGHRFVETVPADGGAVLVAQCESRFTMSDIKLAVDPAPSTPVTLLCRLGLPDEEIREVEWADIDRAVEPDHLTSLWVPEMPPGAGGRLELLAGLMGRLRVEDPWKAEQTHDSLKRYLLEEAHEVLEAIDAYDPATAHGSEELASELGDLLYQVVFHSTLAAEAGWFDLADVVSAIHDKLEARHPHLGTGEEPDLADLVAGWERAKVAEHGRSSAFDGIPAGLPALLRALKLVRKANAMGLEVPHAADLESADGGHGERLMAEALAMAAAGVDPEDDLRRRLAQLERVLREAEA